MHIKEFFAGRVLPLLMALLLVGTAVWVLRVPLLQGMGRSLVVERLMPANDAYYALGGAPLERGQALAAVLDREPNALGFCTGAPIPQTLRAAGMELTEAVLTRSAAIEAGADGARIKALPVGTSTWEEAGAILDHARSNGFDTITIVSTEFHLRRVRRVFRKRFAGSGIAVGLSAAYSLHYDPDRWWVSEEGLLMVNNEYVKLGYYLVRY